MNIKLVRLQSGEEILCDLEVTENTHILKKPLVVIPAGNGQIGFMEWIGYAKTDEGVGVPNTFVVFVLSPIKQLVDEYTQHHSGIIIPDAGGLATAGPSLKFDGVE